MFSPKWMVKVIPRTSLWKKAALLAAFLAVGLFSRAQQRDLLDVYLEWSLDSIDQASNRTYASFQLRASNFDLAGSDWALYYNQLSGTPSAVSGVGVEFEHITGDYFVMRPTKGVQVEAGKVIIPVMYDGIIDRVSDAPKGPYIVAGSWVVAPVDEYIVRGFDNPALDHQDLGGTFSGECHRISSNGQCDLDTSTCFIYLG